MPPYIVDHQKNKRVSAWLKRVGVFWVEASIMGFAFGNALIWSGVEVLV